MGRQKGEGGAAGPTARALQVEGSNQHDLSTPPTILAKRTTRSLATDGRWKSKSTIASRQIMQACCQQKLNLNWPDWMVDDKAGLQDGYFSKILHADTLSGRRVSWPILDLVLIALFGRNFIITIESGDGCSPRPASSNSNVNERYQNIRHWRHRKHFADLGARGAAAYLANTTSKKRKRIARKAARARWRKHRAKAVQS